MSEDASNRTHEEPPLSPSRLGLYLECPRKFQFDKEWRVTTLDQSERTMNFGSATHATIEWLCARVRAPDPTAADAPWRDIDDDGRWTVPWGPIPEEELSDEQIHEYAMEEFAVAWAHKTTASEYLSDAHYEYDRRVAWDGIATYLDDRGYDDVRQSMGTEVTLEVERQGMQLKGRIDNIVRTSDGIELIDYKRNLSNIATGKPYAKPHHDRDGFHPRKVKSLIQAGVYLEAASEAPWIGSALDAHPAGEEAELEFQFYGLVGKSSNDIEDRPDVKGIQPNVAGGDREVRWIYERDRETIWSIIERCYHGIRDGAYDAHDRLDERSDGQGSICDRCVYNTMCPEILELEVTRVD